jgi:hypothetical protein
MLVQKRVRMILEALDLQLHGGKTEGYTLTEKLTIEHLLPQKWQEHWSLGPLMTDEQIKRRDQLLHTFGNMTLLTKQLNPSVSNGAWKQKHAEILKYAAINLNRTLPSAWDEEAIIQRGELLFEKAIRIWPHP